MRQTVIAKAVPDSIRSIERRTSMKHLFSLFILTLSFSGAAFGECSTADKKALEAFDRAWGAAGLGGKREAMADFLAPDFVGLPDMIGKVKTLDDAMATFERNKTNPSTANVAFDHYIVSCTPTGATITHRNVSTAKGDNGKDHTAYSRSVHVLEKRGGKWLAVSSIVNDLDDSAVIWYLEQDWNNALLKRDRGWFEKNYAADFTGVSTATGKLNGKGEEIKEIANDTGLELAETTDMNIRVDGNMAVVTGIFRTKGKDEKGVAYDRRARYTDTWIKRDGRWQAWASQGTLIQ
jgi:ketosteroid isomerase-like protein